MCSRLWYHVHTHARALPYHMYTKFSLGKRMSSKLQRKKEMWGEKSKSYQPNNTSNRSSERKSEVHTHTYSTDTQPACHCQSHTYSRNEVREKKTLSVVTAVISFYKWNTFYGRMREKEWDSKENRREASEKEMKQWSVEICRFVFTCHRSWEKPAVGGYPPK